MNPTRTNPARRITTLLLVLSVALVGLLGSPRAVARVGEVTNLAHLDFLLDEASPRAVRGHTTYRLATEPDLVMPWTYADRRDDGSYRRVGGGVFDPATGDWGQGAYNTDDITRAAVVYLRHWTQTGSRSSRTKAYELLRSVAYLQTVTGPNAGRSVLWMQTDGELNPSAEPVELPDPSDSGPSYWQARTLWAYGEGYAAFRRSDPAFARFLRDRIALSLRALNRDVLDDYGRYTRADGMRVPAWLIVNGADATSEAVLGLSAYVNAAPEDAVARVQSLLAVADVGNRRVARDLAGLQAAWFFGANRSGEAMYDPATGVAFDGLEADGRINRNSGAESTIHGLLTMLALDAHPGVRARATGLTKDDGRDGLRVVEAEAATATTGTVVTPASAWTGESLYSGGKYLELDAGETATLDLGVLRQRSVVEPVAWAEENGTARSRWRQGGRDLGTLRHRVGAQGSQRSRAPCCPGRCARWPGPPPVRYR